MLWSTRKRRDVVVDHPDWTFAQIAKWISDEWKKIEPEEKDELQKEAEEMNELGIRKLPRDDDGPDPDKVGLENDVMGVYNTMLMFRTLLMKTVTLKKGIGRRANQSC